VDVYWPQLVLESASFPGSVRRLTYLCGIADLKGVGIVLKQKHNIPQVDYCNMADATAVELYTMYLE